MKILFIAFLMFTSIVAVANPTEDLFTAATNGDLAAVKKAIADGADVNGFEKNGYTPLMIAMWYPEFILELITAKADFNKQSSNGSYTPLTFAATFGITETIELLVNAGAGIDLKNGWGNTPLLASIGSCKIALLKYFIDKGADTKVINGFNQNMLMILAGSGKSPQEKANYYKLIEDMTVKAGNKIPEMLKKHQDPSLFTPVSEILDYILGLGFNINEENDVMVPASFPNAQMINDGNKKAKTKQSCVTIALNAGNADMIGALLNKGADIGDKKFVTYIPNSRFPSIRIQEADAFLVAVKAGNIELVKQMVEKGKIKVTKEYKGTFISDQGASFKLDDLTPLMVAAATNNKAMCEYLVSAGAKGRPMAKLDAVGGKPSGQYALKVASYAEDFATDEEVKKYLKGLTK